MTVENSHYLVGRQPILCDEQLFGYELLFRSPAEENPELCDPSRATASVILNTLVSFGIADLLGGRKGFINIGHDLLFDDLIEVLPKEHVVIELLEAIRPTPDVVERCRQLKELGFVLALDDHEYDPCFQELYGIVDIVKVDLMLTGIHRLAEAVQHYKPYSLKLLAEKVETHEDYVLCRDLGFLYFQGYYFARPSLLRKKKMDTGGTILLKLLRLLAEDAEIEEIDSTFRGSPEMTYKLLHLVNSVAFSSREKIDSVRRAISMAGRKQIQRWVQLALFAADSDEGLECPLVDMAAVRAGLMEQLSRLDPVLGRDNEAPERAFMTGILSLLSRIYDISIETLISDLNLSDDIIQALVHKQGDYGKLLRIAELLESDDYGCASEALATMNISGEKVMELQMKAFSWRKDL